MASDPPNRKGMIPHTAPIPPMKNIVNDDTTPFNKTVITDPAISPKCTVIHLMAVAQSTICRAMHKCNGSPKGKPAVPDVSIWPAAITTIPSKYPKANAQKYPGAESKAMEPTGLGIFIMAPMALSAMKIAINAIFFTGRLFVSEFSIGVWFIVCILVLRSATAYLPILSFPVSQER